ncbi:hypothetical protein GPY51_08690 [Photorhabdus laumondii subsp. laumondii]|uniref:Photorhabdus luminescens subsp. laumondii TTO1 complete genome segment 3/17 n=2 Tax=Photorhabdus laumondii subsp. laumondii TaxID=141679 RepID=Q7MB78_PHOLL|nr:MULTISPECIES: hypothetical protein [Photorhabdus]AXG46083.1 hypothetical protein PluTT01m_04135 [Photorhabdus laumondii subsp. laumondii]KTL61008.1 hypothetical protein AA106_02015 [Photorhabdus laumondii subsp. laumondii]MCC8383331.1 hypothetical protein [Photorhabdus laumondii]MCC8412935.1 hypothetical protein [Photorhabdus laumondii]NDK94435.1 hypothetical protein [Photorhabdus laumondii subsp. laumondii]
MATEDSIIDDFNGKTKTLGWDIIAAYDRTKINMLFEQQYVRKVSEGAHFSPIFWESENKKIKFDNLILGVPLISFENSSIEGSQATVKLNFISGTIIELYDDGRVKNYQRITPNNNYHMTITVDLIAATGSVDNNGKVVVEFKKGILGVVNVINDAPAEVKEFFRNWLKDNDVTYELGILKLDNMVGLVPQMFKIRTQPAPGANLYGSDNYGHGAVLLFIATNYNPNGGVLPTSSSNFPYLIPDNRSAMLIISNKTLFENILKPQYERLLPSPTGVNLELVKLDSQADDSASYLKITNGYAESDEPVQYEGGGYKVWTGLSKGETNIWLEKVKIPYSGMYIKPEKEKIIFSGEDNNGHSYHFIQTFGVFYDSAISGGWNDSKIDFYIDGSIDITPHVKSNDEIELKLNNRMSTRYDKQDEPVWGIHFYPKEKFVNKTAEVVKDIVENNLSNVAKIKLDSISLFAVNHLLFPESNYLEFDKVYVPGDMVLFGDISPTSTAFRINDLQLTIPLKAKHKFTTNTKATVNWSITPAELGSINANTGDYMAPTKIKGNNQIVTITATDPNTNAKASAVVILVPSSVSISPSFVVINENDVNKNANFTVYGDKKVNWRVETGTGYGVVDANGKYTPPAAFPAGYNMVTVTAVADNGDLDKVNILLISKNTKAEFTINPSYNQELLTPDAVMKFSSVGNDLTSPSEWSLMPERGNIKVGEPEVTKDEFGNDIEKYTATYTAPSDITCSEIVLLRVTHKNKPNRAGYALITLEPKIS